MCEIYYNIFSDFAISSFFYIMTFTFFLWGVLPRNGGQVLKKLLLENGCNLADDNDEKWRWHQGRWQSEKWEEGILQIIYTLIYTFTGSQLFWVGRSAK